METIRVLQKTYENLYVLSTPIVEFLENHLPVISTNWKKEYIDDVIEEITKKPNKVNLYDLDIYYLISILIKKEIWDTLKALFPEERSFFSKENKKLLKDVRQIRNDISHPSLQKYSFKDYEHWTSLISDCARLFDKDLNTLVNDLHAAEKEKILNMVLSKVIEPALNHPGLSDRTRASVENTKDRLFKQNTAEGIIEFFNDALSANRGKTICEKLHECNLLAFEDIADEVLKTYYC